MPVSTMKGETVIKWISCPGLSALSSWCNASIMPFQGRRNIFFKLWGQKLMIWKLSAKLAWFPTQSLENRWKKWWSQHFSLLNHLIPRKFTKSMFWEPFLICLLTQWKIYYYSIEINIFQGDHIKLLEFQQLLDMILCTFFHKNQSNCFSLFQKIF